MMEAKAAARKKGAFIMMVEQDFMLARFLAGLYTHKVHIMLFTNSHGATWKIVACYSSTHMCNTMESLLSKPVLQQQLPQAIIGHLFRAAQIIACMNDCTLRLQQLQLLHGQLPFDHHQSLYEAWS